MKIYAAAIYNSEFGLHGQLYRRLLPIEQKEVRDLKYILESYFYMRTGHHMETICRDARQIFLDSGAFTAFTKNVEIIIDDYCNFIRKYEDLIIHEDGIILASVLDKIGDALGTWRNQKRMEKLGVVPLPCFHYGEDERFLQEYISKYSYITLGGMVPISTANLKIWLDRIWDKYLTNGAGRPRLKVHGFGLTTDSLLKRYPWHSTDSSSWVQSSTFGSITSTKFKNLSVSTNNPSRKNEGTHYSTLSKFEQERIAEIISAEGWDINRLSNIYYSRRAYNIKHINDMNKLYEEKNRRFVLEQRSLF